MGKFTCYDRQHLLQILQECNEGMCGIIRKRAMKGRLER